VIISITQNDDRPIYVQIMDEIRRAIVIGTLRADEPLPSVRQLSADLRVNPNTVQQAYRELERDGVVYVRRGQGTFVAEALSSQPDRDKLASSVAERALRDAYRSGLTVNELIEAIHSLSNLQREGKRATG
jgi:GntR family transcriptional regulator